LAMRCKIINMANAMRYRAYLRKCKQENYCKMNGKPFKHTF
jgi:hypothetical protein